MHFVVRSADPSDLHALAKLIDDDLVFYEDEAFHHYDLALER